MGAGTGRSRRTRALVPQGEHQPIGWGIVQKRPGSFGLVLKPIQRAGAVALPAQIDLVAAFMESDLLDKEVEVSIRPGESHPYRSRLSPETFRGLLHCDTNKTSTHGERLISLQVGDLDLGAQIHDAFVGQDVEVTACLLGVPESELEAPRVDGVERVAF